MERLLYGGIESMDEQTVEELGYQCFRALWSDERKMFLKSMVNIIEAQLWNGSRVGDDTPDFIVKDMKCSNPR
jgi:hypothetical protein